MLPVVVVRAVSLAFALAATWMTKVQYDRLALGLAPCHVTLESCVYPPPYAIQTAQPQKSLAAKARQKPESKTGPVDIELALSDISDVYNQERDGPPPFFSDGKFTLGSFVEAWLETLRCLKEILWFVGTLVAPWLMCTGAFWYLQQRKIWDLKSLAIMADARVIRLQRRYDGLEYQAGIPLADLEGQQSPFYVENLHLKERARENHFYPLDEDARERDESPEANRAVMKSRIFRHAVENLRTERARAHSMAQKVAQLIEALEILQDRGGAQDQYYEALTR